MSAEGGLSDYIDGGSAGPAGFAGFAGSMSSVLGGAETYHWAAGAILLLVAFAVYYWRATIQQWWSPAPAGTYSTYRAALAARRRQQD